MMFWKKKDPAWVLCGALAGMIHWGILSFSGTPFQWSDELRQWKDKAIELVDPDDLRSLKKPIVQSSRLNIPESQTGEARYSGEFNQRVPQEMQSPLKGTFEEGDSYASSEPLDLGSSGEKTESSGLKNLLKLGRSPHMLSKDIPYGNQTLLSTDKVRYASFINRIADEIYSPWVDAAEKAVKDLSLEQRRIEANLYVTRLRVTLDDSGEVQGIQVLQSCGVTELDEAPKKAFWEAEPFPHPPGQLVENDGFIRLTYEFQFEWKNSGFNIIPWKI